jgi:multidrug efflux system membrane fusion protein
MNRILKRVSVALAAILLGAVLVSALSWRHGDPPAQDRDEAQEHGPSRFQVLDGETVITLSAAAQKRTGISVETLREVRNRQQATAPATVLAATELATLRDQYVAGESLVKKAEIAAGVDGKEYQRLKELYAQNQNVSAKVLQAAQGQMQSDQADLAVARQRLELARGGIRQSWGGVVAEWVASGAPALQRILKQQDVLVEVTIPAALTSARPSNVRLEVPAGNAVTANLVSLFPRADPRIQGVSLLYLSPASPGLVPGVNPVARFASGRLRNGVVIPESAVVWWQGSAWAYQQTEPGHFVRRKVETGTPVRGGYFVTNGLTSGDRIVVEGAQMLLSTELAPQRESAGGEDTD